MKTVVITPQCFSCCWAALPKDASASCAALPARSWGGTGAWERTARGQLVQTDQRNAPQLMVPCSAMKAGVKKEEWGCLEWWCMFSLKAITRDELCSPASGWMSACWWEAANQFLILIYLWVQLLLYLQFGRFSTFCLPDSLSAARCWAADQHIRWNTALTFCRLYVFSSTHTFFIATWLRLLM